MLRSGGLRRPLTRAIGPSLPVLPAVPPPLRGILPRRGGRLSGGSGRGSGGCSRGFPRRRSHRPGRPLSLAL
eukprot:9033565-Lingulodinium_polyedra.AAC.1